MMSCATGAMVLLTRERAGSRRGDVAGAPVVLNSQEDRLSEPAPGSIFRNC